MRSLDFWQAFLSLDLTPRKARDLLARLGPTCLSAEDLLASGCLGGGEQAKARAALATPRLPTFKAIGVEDPKFPPDLRFASDSPVALMVDGELLPEDTPAVAIVGTRRASAYGKAVARKLAMDLARAGVTIVSGGAHGIDAQAHLGALEVGGRTIVVLGSGLDKPYPVSNKRIFEKAAESGAVVSQFALGVKPDSWRFPMRNLVIAGLARAVVVVEAPEDSGSLITASVANEMGRHVFATPANLDNPNYRGSYRLINDGATLLSCPDQVLEALGLEARIKPSLKVEVTSQQQAILERLSAEPELPDNVGEALGLPAGVVLAELTSLELAGLVMRSAGGYVRL